MRRRPRDMRRRGNAFGSRCVLLCLSIALIVSSALLVSGQRWPVAQDATLRRITVSNDDGDVYVESSGDGSEIVLKTGKVRITDGDVYCGSSNVGLSAQIDALKTKDDALDERIDTLNDTQIELRNDLDTLETSTSGRLTSIDTTLTSLASTDASLSATDATLSSRIDALNATDAQLKATDEKLATRIASLDATDTALKGVDDDLSSRIDALRDIYVNELNVTDKQLIVTDATLGSRINDLNATQDELKSIDAALSSRIATLESAHTEYERIDDEVASFIDALNATDAAMQAMDASLSDRIDALNATNQALSSVDNSLSVQIASLIPPKCTSPGGIKLRYDGDNWNCTCASGWSGPTCETPPTQPDPDDSWYRSPSYSGSSVPDRSTVEARVDTFEKTCPRSVWVADFTQCDSGAWREVGVATKPTTDLYCGETTNGQACVFQEGGTKNLNTGLCNCWHCWTDVCGPSGDSFYGSNNNWITISDWYTLEAALYSMTLSCDDSCVMYYVERSSGSWTELSGLNPTFSISADGEYRFIFVLGNGAYTASAHIKAFKRNDPLFVYW